MTSVTNLWLQNLVRNTTIHVEKMLQFRNFVHLHFGCNVLIHAVCLLEVYRVNWILYMQVLDALKTCITETDRSNRRQVATFTETRVPVPWILNFAVQVPSSSIYCGSLQVLDYEFRFEYGNVAINQSARLMVRKLLLSNFDVDNCPTVTL